MAKMTKAATKRVAKINKSGAKAEDKSLKKIDRITSKVYKKIRRKKPTEKKAKRIAKRVGKRMDRVVDRVERKTARKETRRNKVISSGKTGVGRVVSKLKKKKKTVGRGAKVSNMEKAYMRNKALAKAKNKS